MPGLWWHMDQGREELRRWQELPDQWMLNPTATHDVRRYAAEWAQKAPGSQKVPA
jgi:hypothetical protein